VLPQCCDQGTTYATSDFRDLITEHRIRQSMSRKGDCWDNAPVQRFFHTLNTELVMHCDYKTRDQARASLFDYLEAFYNRSGGTRLLTTRLRWPSRREKSPNIVSTKRGEDQFQSECGWSTVGTASLC